MNSPAPRYLCAQTGARRGYAVPLILERGNLLERFYTDLVGNIGWGKILATGRNLPIVGAGLSRLGKRCVPAEILEKTFTFAAPNFRKFVRSLFVSDNPASKFRTELRRGFELGNAAAQRGFGKATHLYVMLNEMPRLMTAAKARGITIVSEVYILISTERILSQERKMFPEWDPEPVSFNCVRNEELPEDTLLTSVDWYICPSTAVKDDLVKNWGVASDRTVVIPYGMDPKWLKLEPKPQIGRVLFVGSAELRKGIHYLAMAAELLRARGRMYEFRIAGDASIHVQNHPACRHLTFLGRVPRDRIHEEFQRADVFVLPSLAEGSAEVTYESLAAGVPLVTTVSAGSVARDGVEGQIVSERSAEQLADAIETIVENRELRDRFAIAARERARDYTWERYGERLLEALRPIEGKPVLSLNSA